MNIKSPAVFLYMLLSGHAAFGTAVPITLANGSLDLNDAHDSAFLCHRPRPLLCKEVLQRPFHDCPLCSFWLDAGNISLKRRGQRVVNFDCQQIDFAPIPSTRGRALSCGHFLAPFGRLFGVRLHAANGTRPVVDGPLQASITYCHIRTIQVLPKTVLTCTDSDSKIHRRVNHAAAQGS
jgi:hypothetical protein